MTSDELSFAVFCIESLGDKINQPASKIYDMLTKDIIRLEMRLM